PFWKTGRRRRGRTDGSDGGIRSRKAPHAKTPPRVKEAVRMNKLRPGMRTNRIYRFLLRLFPFDFQREYGSEMESVFHQAYKQARKRGGKSSMVLWRRTLAGFLRSAPMEHLDVFRRDVCLGIRSLAKEPCFGVVSV